MIEFGHEESFDNDAIEFYHETSFDNDTINHKTFIDDKI